MVKFCEFLGKTITVCVLLGCADGTVGGLCVSCWGVRTVLLEELHGKHQVGRPGRDECL